MAAMFKGGPDKGRAAPREIRGSDPEGVSHVGFVDRDKNSRQKQKEKCSRVLLKILREFRPDIKFYLDKTACQITSGWKPVASVLLSEDGVQIRHFMDQSACRRLAIDDTAVPRKIRDCVAGEQQGREPPWTEMF